MDRRSVDPPRTRSGRAAPTCTSTRSPRTAPPPSTDDPRPRRRRTDLDVIAITDHERIDAAVAGPGDGPSTAACALEVVVGEEVTTRGGHLLALFLEARVRLVPLAARRRSPPSTMPAGSRSRPTRWSRTRCARRAGSLRRLLEDPDPRVRPDAIETFNPTRSAGPGTRRSSASPTSTACRTSATATPMRSTPSGLGWTSFPGRTAADLRAAIAARHDRASRHVPRRHRPARDVRRPAPQAGPRRPRRARSAGSAATARAATTATRAGGRGRRGSTPDAAA